EMRRLHGAQRIRSDRRAGCGAPPVEGARGQPARRRHRTCNGAGDIARTTAPGAIRVLTARRAKALRDTGNPSPDQGVDDRVTALETQFLHRVHFEGALATAVVSAPANRALRAG